MNVSRLFVLAVCCISSSVSAATINECKDLLRTGQYEACLDATTEAVERRSYGEDWPILKAEAEMQLGRYLQAQETIELGIQRYAWSIRLRMKEYHLRAITGGQEKRQQLLDEIAQLAGDSPWRYTDADDLVALGETSIALGADPKDVLEGFYNRARRNYKTRPDGFLAAGQLAFDKGDKQLAADILSPAIETFDDNPALLFLLATVLNTSDAERSAELASKALEINPNLQPALLKLAERQIDAESYEQAEATLAKIQQVNPWQPESHALQAVIHHLQSNSVAEAKSRSTAMTFSGASAEIDHLIGTRLSRKYRFAEGAEYQQLALKTNPLFVPAKAQLAQDLLRLGQDKRGWELADDAQNQDKYSTTLFNLMQLKNSLDGFATLQDERFIIRMDRSEATVYGSRVQSLLNRAFNKISQKYGYTPDEPVVVEIFDRQDDFAVRTFGIPDVAGFLGVCFGKLITANSPASQRENPNNWESVLWHEFCHVITLQMTGNKIPRWLSEGISVYEERLEDSRWGQSMSPKYRERVTAGNITPVSELSSAFLNAGSGEDLNFAYYESSMVVEFIVQEHGFDALTGILTSLKDGLTINDALDRHTGGLEALDTSFDEYLKTIAKEYAPKVEFAPLSNGEEGTGDLQLLSAANPNHYTAGLAAATGLIRAEDYAGAEKRLLQLIKLYPADASGNGARKLLATVYERQELPEKQAEVLEEHLQRSGEDLQAAMKLLNLQLTAQAWTNALATGQLVMAIDPLQPRVLRSLLEVAEATDSESESIQLLNGLLELEPADAARWHYQLAEIYMDNDATAARRHVLLSLEQAPRYQDAHRLLLALTEKADSDQPIPVQDLQ